MRIAIDGRYVQDRFPGIGRYTFNLIRHLALVGEDHRFVVFHNPALPNARHQMSALARFPNVELVRLPAGTPSFAEHWRLPLAAYLKRADLLHAPYYVRPYVLPLPSVTTVYDVISARYPDYLPSRKARLAFGAATRLALLTSRRILTLSKCSREDLTRLYNVPPENVAVTYLAADARYRPLPPDVCRPARQRYGLPERFALYVGINKPHKNLVHLVESLALARKRADVRLVIAGAHDARYPQVHEATARLDLERAVHFIPDVSEEDLPLLYNLADFFVFPSLYEGFGLPPLEAMSCGLPVICSNRSSLPEVTGDAAVLLDPLDAAAWAEALLELWASAGKRAELRGQGLARAALFSWNETARGTLAAYVEALGA